MKNKKDETLNAAQEMIQTNFQKKPPGLQVQYGKLMEVSWLDAIKLFINS